MYFKLTGTVLLEAYPLSLAGDSQMLTGKLSVSAGSIDEGVTEGLQSIQGTPNTTGPMEEDERQDFGYFLFFFLCVSFLCVSVCVSLTECPFTTSHYYSFMNKTPLGRRIISLFLFFFFLFWFHCSCFHSVLTYTMSIKGRS